MNRRDMIIIAVLINAGLLIVLFASALKSNSAKEELAFSAVASAPVISELPIRSAPQAAAGDEVDLVLKQFGQASTQTPATVETKPNFAGELRAVMLPETPVTSPVLPQTPAAVAPAPTASASEVIEVKVKKGDFLEKIARANNTTVDEIMRQNHLTSTNLSIGQVLKISPKGAVVAKKEAAPATPSDKFYTVKNGDNPWTIAVKNHMKVDELLKLNHLDEEKARRLKPGDQLRIR
jgi:peptidoglycan endopeptidase LytF